MGNRQRRDGYGKPWPMGKYPRMYRMAFPDKGGPRICPVEVCPGQATTRTAMRVHFLHRHVLDNVVILEEVNTPHPWLPQCDMLVPCRTMNRRHHDTAQCARGAE